MAQQLTCVFISKDNACGAPVIGQCNMCKVHLIQTLLDQEKLDKKASKIKKSEQAPVEDEKPKKSKKEKDPNKPKKAKTAYMVFCEVKRPEIQEKNPEMKSKEIIVRLGEMWGEIKGVPENIKQYVDLAAKDKERYDTEMASYNSE